MQPIVSMVALAFVDVWVSWEGVGGGVSGDI